MVSVTIYGMIKALVVGAATVIVAALGGWDKALQALVFFVVADYVSGLLLAMKNRQFSSTIGFSGMVLKLGYFLAVAGAHAFDSYISDSNPWARTAVTMIFIVNEAGSFFANLTLLGVPIPKILTDALRAEIERKAPKALGG